MQSLAHFADGGLADLAPAHVTFVPMQDQGAAVVLHGIEFLPVNGFCVQACQTDAGQDTGAGAGFDQLPHLEKGVALIVRAEFTKDGLHGLSKGCVQLTSACVCRHGKAFQFCQVTKGQGTQISQQGAGDAEVKPEPLEGQLQGARGQGVFAHDGEVQLALLDGFHELPAAPRRELKGGVAQGVSNASGCRDGQPFEHAGTGT